MDKKIISFISLIFIGLFSYSTFAGNGVVWHRDSDGVLVYEFVDSIDPNIENLVDELSARADLNLSLEQSSALKMELHKRGLTYEKKEAPVTPPSLDDVKAGSGKVKSAEWTK